MGSTTDFRNGLIIRFNGDLHQIVEWRHHKPGKGGAMVQTKLRNMRTGSTFENRFRPGESVDVVRVERRRFQYLYPEGEDLCFMDQESFEQIHVPGSLFGDSVRFLKEGEICEIALDGEAVIEGDLPITVELEVTETEPGLRGDTATGGTKRATVSTGAIVNVPLFIEQGTILKIDTRTGAYLERVNK
ncbi:MAG: elongation factor P [Ignavibacteria bacterium]|nr:elongation factor P [Ignavibacteria bacterium]